MTSGNIMAASAVQFIRYVRPRDEEGGISNLGGATFVFTLNYKNRTVEIQTALCSPKDNFDKKLGLQTALISTPRVINLDKFQQLANQWGGFVPAYIHTLSVLNVVESISNPELVFLRKFLAAFPAYLR